MYAQAVIELKKEIESANLNQLEQAMQLIEQQHQGLEQTAALLSNDLSLKGFNLRENDYEASKVRYELEKYLTTVMAKDVYLYYRGEDHIYSTRGLLTLNTLATDVYQFEDWPEKRLKQELNETNRMTVKPAEDVIVNNSRENRVLTYLIPIPVHDVTPDRTLMFLMNESVISNTIKNTFGDFNQSVYIIDESRRIIASNVQGSYLSETEVLTIFNKDRSKGISGHESNGEAYSIARVNSTLMGWSFLIVMPTDQLFERVIETKKIVYLAILILVISGLATAMYAAIKQYRPIRELTEHVRTYWIRNSQDEPANEFIRIRTVLQEAFESHRELTTQITKQRPFVTEQFLHKLLRGGFRERLEVEELIAHQQLQLSGPCFVVMFISIPQTTNSTSHIKESLFRLANRESDEATCYGVQLMKEEGLAILVNIHRPADPLRSQQERMARALMDEIKRSFDIHPTIAISTASDQIMSVNRLFIEATAAAEYRLKLGAGQLIFFDDIQSFEGQTQWYPLEEQVRLVQSLKQGNLIIARETLDCIMKKIAQQEQSFLLLKCMCFEVINAVLKTVNEMGLPPFKQHVQRLLEFQTMEGLNDQLNELIEDICAYVQTREENESKEWNQRILDYIHEHFRDYDFSRESTAEAFGLSVSYLSRFMKELTGETFKQYVSQLRLSEIKRQLVETDLSIQQIIMDNGYADVSNFSRTFKQIEGLTPGQFRKAAEKGIV